MERLSAVELDTLAQTFKKFDVDNSQSIDVAELEKVMEHLGVTMQRKQLQELVEQVDVNVNGELEFEEFCQLITMWRYASKFKLFDAEGMESLSKGRMHDSLRSRLLLPDSWPRCAFDGVIALAACVYWVTVLLDDAWGSNSNFIAVDALVTTLFLIDMVVCTLTCHFDGILLVESPRETALHYLKTWAAPDLLAAIPWDLLMQGTVSGRVLRHLRLLKVCKIPHLWKPSGRVPINANTISFHFKLLPITLLVLQFLLLCHAFAVGFMVVKQAGKIDPLLDKDGFYPYDAALYFVVYSLYTVGNGDIDLEGPYEKAYACIVLCGTLLTNAFITGKLVSITQKADIHEDRTGKLRETLAALQEFKIPPSLQDEVLQFQDHLLAHSLSASYASIVEGLPEEMQMNISLFVKLRLISICPYLESAHYIVKVAIAEALANTVTLPEQYIQVIGEPVATMFFIAHGFVDLFTTGGVHLKTLHNNNTPYFGESALFRSAESTVSAKALTYCDLWGLHRTELTPLLRRFPRFNRLVMELGEAWDRERSTVAVDPALLATATGAQLSQAQSEDTPEAVPTPAVKEKPKVTFAEVPRKSLSAYVAFDAIPQTADDNILHQSSSSLDSGGHADAPQPSNPLLPRRFDPRGWRRQTDVNHPLLTVEERLEEILDRLGKCALRVKKLRQIHGGGENLDFPS
jgi:hypothetical protein